MRGVVVLEDGTAALGHVHGHVRMAQQDLRIARVVRITRDADAHAHFDGDTHDIDGRAQAVRKQLRRRCDCLVAVRAIEHHGEFVTADARDESAIAERSRKALRHVAQHAIADIVSQGVVDFLEAAQVEHEQRQRCTRRLGRERSLEMREQGRPVREAGQRIVRRLVLQAALLRAPLAYVAHDGGVQPFGVEPHAAHGDLDRKHFAVQRAGIAFADHAMQRAEACAGAIARQERDELGDGLIDELVGRAVEQA